MFEQPSLSPKKPRYGRMGTIISGTRTALVRHPRRLFAATIVGFVAIVGATWWYAHQSPSIAPSKNPIIANYQKQLPSLAQAVQKNGNDPQAHYNYAVALYATGDIAKAKDQYEAESKINQNDPTVYNNLGNVYRDLGQYQKAVDAYQKSIKLNPKAANPYINLANVYQYTLNQRDLAIKTYKDALSNIPNNQDLEILLGIAYEQAGDKTNARATYQLVLGQNANNAAASAGLKRVQ